MLQVDAVPFAYPQAVAHFLQILFGRWRPLGPVPLRVAEFAGRDDIGDRLTTAV